MNLKGIVFLIVTGFVTLTMMSCTAPEPDRSADRPEAEAERPEAETEQPEAETERADQPDAVSPAEAAPADEPQPPEPAESALDNPSMATETAPENFRVRVETTKGPFVIEVLREWAPRGADRFYNLVRAGFFNDIAFFRVLDGFVVQFGIHGEPEVAAKWQTASIRDDPVNQPNARGTLVFATAGPNTRTTQLFINLVDNSRSLDSRGFAPFGQIVEGMSVVDSLYSGYGEGAPRGSGPSQDRIRRSGNEYLRREFPRLDYVKTADLIE